MKHTPEELIKALTVIKEECLGDYNCDECPLQNRASDTFRCSLSKSPIHWEFTPPPERWKAFKG